MPCKVDIRLLRAEPKPYRRLPKPTLAMRLLRDRGRDPGLQETREKYPGGATRRAAMMDVAPLLLDRLDRLAPGILGLVPIRGRFK